MRAVHNAIETLLNEHDVALITGLSVASVRRRRLQRQGPKYLKLGAAVRYRPGDVDAWLSDRPCGGDVEEKVQAGMAEGASRALWTDERSA
jgi:predicted DNA-binding transcriptional regulator AlpA